MLSQRKIEVAVNNTCETANDIYLPDAVGREGQCEKSEARGGPRRNDKMAEQADVLVAF